MVEFALPGVNTASAAVRATAQEDAMALRNLLTRLLGRRTALREPVGKIRPAAPAPPPRDTAAIAQPGPALDPAAPAIAAPAAGPDARPEPAPNEDPRAAEEPAMQPDPPVPPPPAAVATAAEPPADLGELREALEALAAPLRELNERLRYTGERLDAAAERQDRLAAALAKLPDLAAQQLDQGRGFADFVRQLHAALGRQGETLETLTEAVNELTRQAEGTQDNSERLAEGLEQLGSASSELAAAENADRSDIVARLAEQLRLQQAIHDLLARHGRRTRQVLWVIAALAAGALAVALLALGAAVL